LCGLVARGIRKGRGERGRIDIPGRSDGLSATRVETVRMEEMC